MPKTNKERQEALRQRRVKLNLKRREYWLNDSERVKMDACLIKLRSSNGR